MAGYPQPLQEIIDLFEGLPESERREMLVSFAESASRCEPEPGEEFDLEDVRKDDECTDEVGVFLRVDGQRRVFLRVRLGDKVQTLTRALASLLCRGFEGVRVEEVLATPDDFVPRVVGGQLLRLRSQTVYYVLGRMKSAVREYLRRREAAAAGREATG